MDRRLKPAQRHSIAVFVLVVMIGILLVSNNRGRVANRLSNSVDSEYEQRADSLATTLSEFDPNTVTLAEMLAMGLSRYEALSILRYRASGKVFRIKEELIGCWGVSDSLYFALEPYMVIGSEFGYKPDTVRYESRAKVEAKSYLCPSPFCLDTVSAEYIAACGLLTLRQAEVMLRWHATSHIANEVELRECYVVSDKAADQLVRYVLFTPPPATIEEGEKIDSTKVVVEFPIAINQADSATLCKVNGIGAKSAAAIVQRRGELGGFSSVHQLREIEIVTKSNFEKIISQIFVDSCGISKIDVNFASANELESHPYITDKMVRRILHKKQLKGGWSNIEEMIDDKIFTSEEAVKMRPYLNFVLPEESYQ